MHAPTLFLLFLSCCFVSSLAFTQDDLQGSWTGTYYFRDFSLNGSLVCSSSTIGQATNMTVSGTTRTASYAAVCHSSTVFPSFCSLHYLVSSTTFHQAFSSLSLSLFVINTWCRHQEQREELQSLSMHPLLLALSPYKATLSFLLKASLLSFLSLHSVVPFSLF